MKVYVDELPKRCLECGFCCKDDLGYWCQGRESIGGVFIADEMCVKQRLMSCPLQSLADHDKQVRKDTIGDLKEILKKNGKCSIRVNGTMDFFIELDKLNEILDQIQGEKND